MTPGPGAVTADVILLLVAIRFVWFLVPNVVAAILRPVLRGPGTFLVCAAIVVLYLFVRYSTP